MGTAYNVMAATCPSRTVLHRIGARWTVFVMNALDDGPRRFSDLKGHIRGITSKALTETLRSLEADGLISRHEYDENPPRVEYALTPLAALCSSHCAPYDSGLKSMSRTSRWPEPAGRFADHESAAGTRRSGRTTSREAARGHTTRRPACPFEGRR